MKKFIILSGAYINAGDFLIVKRTEELLRYVYPKCEIKKYERNRDLTEYIEEINNSDAIIIAGGPAYKPKMYPDTIKLVDDLSKINVKIIPIGVGWYGDSDSNDYIYNYIFNDESKKLLNKISDKIDVYSCRDWYSAKILNLNGYSNAIMTGCPAWYNLEKINQIILNQKNNFKKICISDPAKKINFDDALELVDYLRSKFPESELNFVFHRIDKNNNKYNDLLNKLKNKNVNIIDITGNVEGFKIYDDCDLHIGFRVHAHIYNLSNRNLSILIEEDGRGIGVNQALGLQGFKSTGYNSLRFLKNNTFNKCLRRILKKFVNNIPKKNKYLIKDIDNYLTMCKKNDYIQHEIAFFNMKKYFNVMIDYIKNTIDGGK